MCSILHLLGRLNLRSLSLVSMISFRANLLHHLFNLKLLQLRMPIPWKHSKAFILTLLPRLSLSPSLNSSRLSNQLSILTNLLPRLKHLELTLSHSLEWARPSLRLNNNSLKCTSSSTWLNNSPCKPNLRPKTHSQSLVVRQESSQFPNSNLRTNGVLTKLNLILIRIRIVLVTTSDSQDWIDDCINYLP